MAADEGELLGLAAADATAACMAAWRSATVAKGRAAKARSATHGDFS